MAKSILYTKSFYLRAVKAARKRLAEGKLEHTRAIINQFVDTVTVYNDYINLTFNFDGIEDTVAQNTKVPHERPTRGRYAIPLFDTNRQIGTIIGGEQRTPIMSHTRERLKRLIICPLH